MITDKMADREVHASNSTSSGFRGDLGRVGRDHLDSFEDCGAAETDGFTGYGAVPVAAVLFKLVMGIGEMEKVKLTSSSLMTTLSPSLTSMP
jgi:hypothetical protein